MTETLTVAFSDDASRVRYWLAGRKVQNFGDYLSEYLLAELFLPLGKASEGIHLVGSVLDEWCIGESLGAGAQEVVFWGCGAREPGELSPAHRAASRILAVRGPLTASELRLGADVPQADPAFLLPALHTPRARPEFQGRSLCIPHFNDVRSDAELLAISGCDLLLRPNIADDLTSFRNFVDAVVSADFVLSAALHGAIVAAAYERPFAFWDPQFVDVPFKWADFAESVSIPARLSSSLADGKAVYETEFAPRLQLPAVWPLLTRAPLPIRPDALLRVLRHELKRNGQADIAASLDPFEAPFLIEKARFDEMAHNLRQRINLATREVAELRSTRDNIREELLSNQHSAETRLAEVEGRLERQEAEAKAHIASLEQQLKREQQKVTLRERQARSAFDETVALSRRLSAIETSSTWRIASLLASTANRMPTPMRRQMLRALRAAWWTVTLQLPARLKAWKAHRTRLGLGSTPPSTPGHRPLPKVLQNVRGPVALIIDDRFPEPDRDSGSLDAVNLIESLVAFGYHVVFATCAPFNQEPRYLQIIRELGAHPLTADDAIDVRAFIEIHRDEFSLCILNRVGAGGQFIELIRYNCPRARIIFNTVDLHYVREARAARLASDAQGLRASEHTREREEFLANSADLTIVVSETERDLLRHSVPGAEVLHLPLARTIKGSAVPFSDRKGVGFIGGFSHAPNVDAVRYFLADVWPKVHEACPDIGFEIVGADLPKDIAETLLPGVRYLGHVADIDAWFDSLKMTVAPLRIGAGAKGKIVSSLSASLPCVASEVAAEGMGLTEGETILIGRSPDELAEQIIRLHEQGDLWRLLSVNGTKFAEDTYSKTTFRTRLREAILKLELPAFADQLPQSLKNKG